jgi:hypothetical protein
MRHDVTYGRDDRWVEGQAAVSTPHVASHVGVGQAMSLDLLFKEAFSNV